MVPWGGEKQDVTRPAISMATQSLWCQSQPGHGGGKVSFELDIARWNSASDFGVEIWGFGSGDLRLGAWGSGVEVGG